MFTPLTIDDWHFIITLSVNQLTVINYLSMVSFLSLSSHLPVYLVAAFAKRLSRLALTAPPAVLLMVLPFICNLIRRHPACRVLIHRPSGADGKYPHFTPYIHLSGDGNEFI